MRTRAGSALTILLCLLLLVPAEARADAYDAHPALIVIIVIDQLRGDLLERYRNDFGAGGFRMLLDKGADFPDCYYGYANTFTAPGHATIATGAYSDGHGIAENQWWDLARNTTRPVSSVEDERYTVVGSAREAGPSASPRNLRASTLGDELRLATGGESRVFAVSLKDRAAILSAGASANGAFWIDEKSGRWITSSYYMVQLPEFARKFNAGDAQADAVKASGVATVTNFYEQVGATNAGNDYELAFAKALIEGEQLGRHKTTDLLVISLSANDLMGHAHGPDSPEQRAMLLALDASLGKFFAALGGEVPGVPGNVWIALSADHGIAPTAEEAAKVGMPSALVPMNTLVAALNSALNKKLSPGGTAEYVLSHQGLPYLSLNPPEFTRAGMDETQAENAVIALLPQAFAALPPTVSTASPAERAPVAPSLAFAYSRVQVARGELPRDELGALVAHSYSPNGGWWVMLDAAPFEMDSGSPMHTTHYSAWSYDRHVPLAFYGAPFVAGIYRGRVAPVDMAATLASLLGINQPSASVGRVLTEALHPPQEGRP